MYCSACRSLVRAGRTLALVFSLVAVTSCSRQGAKPQPQRLAILRFENLGPDGSGDWMGRAFSEILTNEMKAPAGVSMISSARLYSATAGFGARPAAAPGISSERTLAIASGATRIGYGEYSVRGGTLEARLTVEDPATGKMVKVAHATGPAGDLMGVAAGLAAQLSGGLRAKEPQRQAALEAWATAFELGGGDDARAQALLERAVAADPDFGPAYRSLAARKARGQDLGGAEAILERALARGNRFDEAERARIELDMAALRGDAAARERALKTLAGDGSADPTAWAALAESATNRRDFAGAVTAYEKLLESEPENAGALNQLGYAAVYAGDLERAQRALRRYSALRPADPNPFDSLGDVNVIAGKLREAEGFYLEAAQKSPGFLNHGDLYKAAVARLMTGDVNGADGLAQKYIAAREAAHDPLVDYYRAEWAWSSGRRAEALKKMALFAHAAAGGTLKEAAARAFAEAAIWSVLLGDRNAASQTVQQAVPLASGQVGAIVGIAAFLAQPPAPAAETAERAERMFRGNGATTLRDLAVAEALLLGGDFRGASQPLEQIYRRTNPLADDGTTILLAWAWLKSGREKDAAPLLRFNPIIPNSPGAPVAAFTFPRIFQLRAMVAESEGKADEARANARLFEQLSGPERLIWEKAR